MRLNWHVVLISIPVGVSLAFFQNCAQPAEEVALVQDISTFGELSEQKPLTATTFGTTRAHMDLQNPLGEGAEVTLELISYGREDLSQIKIIGQSPNLQVFALSTEGLCPHPDTFSDPMTDTPPVTMGTGYLIKDVSSQKYLYLVFKGYRGESSRNQETFNLTQINLAMITPKPGVSFAAFLNDICGEPSLAMIP